MLNSVVALALFGGLFASHPADKTQTFKVQGWTAEVRTDAFTGAVSCRLRSGRMTVSRGAAAFKFGGGVNTVDAEYRIDGGPARSGRMAEIGVAQLGIKTISDSPTNSSGGVVHIPVTELSAASTVAIRASRKASARNFDIRGLGAALDTEKQRGCDQTRPF